MGHVCPPGIWIQYITAALVFIGHRISLFLDQTWNKDSDPATLSLLAEKKLSKKEKAAAKAPVVDFSMLDQFKDDPKFQEFLLVHKRGSAEAWTNDSIRELAGRYQRQNLKNSSEGELDEDEVKDKRTMKNKNKNKKVNTFGPQINTAAVKPVVEKKQQIFFHIKLYNLPYKFKKKHVKAFLAPLKPPSIRLPPKIHGIAYVGFLTEKERNQALNKHKSLHEGHQIFVVKYEKPLADSLGRGSHTDAAEGANPKWRQQEEGLAGAETVGESGRIFVRNLTYSVTEEDLRELFASFGPLTEVNLPIDRLTRRSKGFAFVTFMMPEHAVAAFSQLDGTTFQGRLLHLIPGKVKEGEEEGGEGKEGASYKKKKAKKEKTAAGSSHNWNSLFLGNIFNFD